MDVLGHLSDRVGTSRRVAPTASSIVECNAGELLFEMWNLAGPRGVIVSEARPPTRGAGQLPVTDTKRFSSPSLTATRVTAFSASCSVVGPRLDRAAGAITPSPAADLLIETAG